MDGRHGTLGSWEGPLERKFHKPETGALISGEMRVAGYASLFGQLDQSGDIVQPGAYATSLAEGRGVKMLWQHDPAQPIGVWDEIREDAKGLWVSGRLLPEVAQAREAAALMAAGAVDGLSIGYRVKRSERDQKGRRLLTEVELWEVSLVTFPALPTARVARKSTSLAQVFGALSDALAEVREEFGRPRLSCFTTARG